MSLLALLALTVNLGLWQLRRADEKRALMAQAAAGRQHTVVLNSSNAASLPRYQHVQLSGQFDGDHQVLLDNMPSKEGRPGYRVLTPLRLAGDTLILIDRGWVPLGADRRVLPMIAVDTAPRSVAGIIDVLPQPGVRAGSAGLDAKHWPQVLNYPRVAELRQLYGPALQARIVLMDANLSDGFERVWAINVGFGPERHIGYAVQWFGMAATLLIIYIVVNLKRASSASR